MAFSINSLRVIRHVGLKILLKNTDLETRTLCVAIFYFYDGNSKLCLLLFFDIGLVQVYTYAAHCECSFITLIE